MRISRRNKMGLNSADIEPHREENPDDWKKNKTFREAVIKINKTYGFIGKLAGRVKRR